MADLLTHALVAFSVGTVLSWRFERIDARFITVLMMGSVLPDLTRVGIIMHPSLIVDNLGIPFSWHPLHTVGGVFLVILIITLLVGKDDSRITFSMLSIGAVSHLLLDAFLIKASGYSYNVFFPITTYSPELPGFYLSTDVWPAILAGSIAIMIWVVDSYDLFDTKKED